MTIINPVKILKTVNVLIDGIPHSRKYDTDAEAKEMFLACVEANKNPTEENTQRVQFLLNKLQFVLKGNFLMVDKDTDTYYIKGIDSPICKLLGSVIDEYVQEGYNTDSLRNFATLLMRNPDTVVRNDLFQFIQTHDFTITDRGYMVVYKAVTHKHKVDNDLASFVGSAMVTAKKYKKSPKQYCVYTKEDGERAMTLEATYSRWKESGKDDEMGLSYNGNLSTLYDNISNIGETVFTDKHTKTMDIKLGVPVVMDRKECDNNPQNECSYGLHVGATRYVQSFGNSDDTYLLCLVNPAHVVSVPAYDRSKMRVSEYYPYGIVSKENGTLKSVKTAYFESDYCVHEKEELEEAIKNAGDSKSPEVQAMKIRVLDIQ